MIVLNCLVQQTSPTVKPNRTPTSRKSLTNLGSKESSPLSSTLSQSYKTKLSSAGNGDEIFQISGADERLFDSSKEKSISNRSFHCGENSNGTESEFGLDILELSESLLQVTYEK